MSARLRMYKYCHLCKTIYAKGLCLLLKILLTALLFYKRYNDTNLLVLEHVARHFFSRKAKDAMR